MDKVIRVLHVLDKLSLNSGVSSVVINYYDHMEHDKIIFDFMVHEDTPAYFKEKLKSTGSIIYQMPELKTKNLLKYIKALNNFFKFHKEYKIVHGHIANAAIFYLNAAKRYGVPVRIIHSHNSKGADNILKKVRNYLLNLPIKNLANNYLACSDKAAEFLYGKNFTINNNVFILNNAIDVKKYSFDINLRNELRKKMNIENAYVIGHVGRFCKQKNHIFLIDIFNLIYQYNSKAVLLLIGEGELETQIREKVHKLELEDSVFFMGIRNNVNELMQVMDIFVLPSLFEGLPVVGIEAQASGLPCIFSSAITKQADLTGDVSFIDISDNIEEWKDKIFELSKKNRTIGNIEKIKEAGFYINDQSIILSNYYESLYNKGTIAE